MFAIRDCTPRLGARQQGPQDNAAAAAILLARALGHAVPAGRIRRAMRNHSNPTTMLAILDTLKDLGLDVGGVRVTPEALGTMPLPAIVHLRESEGDAFALLCALDGTGVTLGHPERGRQTVDRQHYLERATGIYVIQRAPPSAPLRLGLRDRLELRLEAAVHAFRRAGGWLIAGALIGVAAWSLAGGGAVPPWARGAVLAAALTQLFLGRAMVDLGAGMSGGSSRLLHRLCSISSRGACARVLAWPMARVFGSVPVASLGAGLSLGVLVLTLLAGLVPAAAIAAWTAVTALVSAALAVGLGFVWSMARVLRMWCVGCALYHGLSAASAGVAWWVLARGGFPVPADVRWIAAAGVVWLLAQLLVPFLDLARLRLAESKAAREELIRITQTPGVLQATYASGPAFTGGGEAWALGRPDAPAVVDLFVHPYCPHCPGGYAALADLAATGRVRLAVRLCGGDPQAPPPALSSARAKLDHNEINALLHAVGATRGAAGFHEALGKVLSAQAEIRNLPLSAVLERMGLTERDLRNGLPGGYARLRSDGAVAARHNVVGTPTLFLNGRLVPTWATPAQQLALVGALAASHALPPTVRPVPAAATA